MLKKDAIKYFGTARKLAKTLRISSAAVSQWGEVIPEKNAYKLQFITKGKLKIDLNLYK
ncbi:Cro/CI family transcriptional regulator [Aggregatibacter segnis]|uniref:Cro/CI family transcriptional regulator n=1 Tax=Aggregatibacter segnis TaxID=739 RepID=UPI003FA0A9D3